MKARKGGNRLERLKNLCEVHGVLLHPEHPSNELVIDCNGNKYTVDKHFNMFDTDYLFSFYNNICILWEDKYKSSCLRRIYGRKLFSIQRSCITKTGL